MYHKVEAWVDLGRLDYDILAFWQDNRSFEKLREMNRGRPPWSFLDGPITANNPMGFHHAWGRTLKDAFQRYWAMNRRELRYQNGFDCQGLWVEVEVEKQLGFRTKKDIEAYGISEFVERCRERVETYAAVQTEQSIRLGYWMDWNDSYYTMSEENNYSIWEFLKKCHDKGLVYKGQDVMPWCPRCGTAISQHEMHEGYKDVTHESVVVRFPLMDRPKEALLVWTTTPWTLTANAAVAVRPEIDYVKAEQGDWAYYLAAASAQDVLGNGGDWRVVSQMKGSDLLSLTYAGPFDDLEAARPVAGPHPVIPWKDVSDDEGTGVVHIAPGCGKEDYHLGIQHHLEAISPIDEGGIFLTGFGRFTGKHAGEVPHGIFASLAEKELLYQTLPYSHSYPHCWRCKEPLLFRKVDEWFISMDEWRESIMASAQRAEWIPAFGLDLEMDWLKNMQDWMISKKRYWGLALPIWECEDCGDFQVIGSREELHQKASTGWDEFEGHTPHKPWIDRVTLSCKHCNGSATRIPDVGNPWLDAGIVPYSTLEYRKDPSYWSKWMPADLVLEGFSGQYRNWFYSLLAMSTMMENMAPFRTLVGHGLVNDEHGEEMHKSKGNAIPFESVADELGCDVLRWMFGRQDLNRNLNFSLEAAKEIRGRFFNTLWNAYGYFANYARLAPWCPPERPTPVQERSDLDRWILSQLHMLLRHSRKHYEVFNLKGLVLAAEDFVEDLSNRYIRHNRRRFWKIGDEADSALAFETLYDCLSTLIRLLAPVIPFTTEEMYQNLVRSHDRTAPESVHHTVFPASDADAIDSALSRKVGLVMDIIALGYAARERASIKNRQPLRLASISGDAEDTKQTVERFEPLLKEFLNVKSLEVLEPDTPRPEVPVYHMAKPKWKGIARKIGKKQVGAFKAIAKREARGLAEKIKRGSPIRLDLDGRSLSLTPDDFTLVEKREETVAFAEDRERWISFDTCLDEELKLEGMMRDLLRRLQVYRKESELEVEDRIDLTWQSGNPDIRAIFGRWQDYLSAELLCTQLAEGHPGDDAGRFSLGGAEVRISVTKAG